MITISYLNLIHKFIQVFTEENDIQKRLEMVSLMESHILSLNQFTQNILRDNQPIMYCMQYEPIEKRIHRMEDLFREFTSADINEKWNYFLGQEMQKLVSINLL
jgi:hypothetical protein